MSFTVFYAIREMRRKPMRFAATVLMILLAAVSHIYSLGLCRAHADRMFRIRREIAAEYLRLFLILSGGVFVLGCAAVLLI